MLVVNEEMSYLLNFQETTSCVSYCVENTYIFQVRSRLTPN